MPAYGFSLNEFIELIPKEDVNNVKSLVNERLALWKEIKSIERKLSKIDKEIKLIFKKKNPKNYEAYEKNARDPLVLMGR